ncbi:filamentous hemagglutinin [Nostoc sp. CENA543]|uniref:beta strand repeat-containing protein n=1 Tax=Nostoc sp. CENA543 TaxID=1869241 RepID=UPI000CA2CB59|nr:S-layer family protein [Nostoc sp. CENA543]AUT00547.1 filamentous hemagglutinin [Nostoc sp. CENA543]
MKVTFANLSLIGAVYILAIGNSHVQAQVTPDSTLSTAVSGSNSYNITGGTRVGNNLFHSFSQFSIPSNGSASFDNATDIQNIFSRVTGGNVSNINGSINANGIANLFLLNPAGIIFGQNASLNIGGSFVGTTANSIKFADGFEFSAVNPQNTPLLTFSVPIGLQMGSNPGAIVFNGSGYGLERLGNAALRATSESNLQVKPGKTLTLLGSNISMVESRISSSSGNIELGSVKEGAIDLQSTSEGWRLGYENVLKFGDIKLDQAIIDALAPGGASIRLRGENISLHNGSKVIIQNQGLKPSGGISINAVESLEVSGLHPKLNEYSDIYTESLVGLTGDINISTQRLKLSGGQGIFSMAINSQGSNIIVKASESIKLEPDPLNPTRTSHIETTTFSSKRAGDVILSTNDLIVLGGSRVSSITTSSGDGGNVNINTKSIEVTGITSDFVASVITAGSLGQGNAGNLLINTDRLTIRDGGRVDSSGAANGNAGSVTINAGEFIEVNGTVPGSINPSLIISSANLLDESLRQALRLPPAPTGKSGNVAINTPVLRVMNGAQVTVKNDGTGNAGSLKINANSIFLDRKGGITAATKSGEGGDITINLKDSLIIRRGSRIDTESLGTGNGGNITINSPIIGGFENSDIIANALNGNGGNINITTQGIFGLEFRNQLTPQSDITASSQFGVNGTVEVNNVGVDPNSSLVELPANVTDQSQQITSGCSNTSGSSFIATGRGGIPKNPTQELRSDRPWSDIRNISAFQTTPQIQSQTPPNPQIPIQATSWHRNAQGKVELVAISSVTPNPSPLTCSAISQG